MKGLTATDDKIKVDFDQVVKDIKSDLTSYATIKILESYARTTDLDLCVKKADYDSLKKEIKDLKE